MAIVVVRCSLEKKTNKINIITKTMETCYVYYLKHRAQVGNWVSTQELELRLTNPESIWFRSQYS